MSKADPDCKGCRGSGNALGSEKLGACACTKRYTYASVTINLHIPGVGDIPIKAFDADELFMDYNPNHENLNEG